MRKPAEKIDNLVLSGPVTPGPGPGFRASTRTPPRRPGGSDAHAGGHRTSRTVRTGRCTTIGRTGGVAVDAALALGWMQHTASAMLRDRDLLTRLDSTI